MVNSRAVILALVVLRLAAAAVLVLGPWTDEAHELAGWDVARFQELADAPGRAYQDFEAEYPPGSLAVVEAVAGTDVTATHDRLVLVGLAADLLLAALLARGRDRTTAAAYLALGTPLLPGIYLRLDVLATLLAAAAVLPLGRRAAVQPATAGRGPDRGIVARAGLALPAAYLVKLWPALLLPALVARRRWVAAVAASAGVVVATGAWVAWAGTGALGQVVGYRGAQGWHVESLVGAVVGLATGAPAELEAGAYRLGTAPGWARALLLAAAAAVSAGAWVGAWRRPSPAAVALASLSSLAALLAASALLSPQFLVWTLPFAAVCWVEGERLAAGLLASAIVLTAAVLAGFGPPGLDNPWAELLLVLRGGLLVAVAVVGLWRLGPIRGRGREPAPAPAASSAW